MPVVVKTTNVPTGATITLTILDEDGVADTVITATVDPSQPQTQCTSATNVCTTTVNIPFGFGSSRGLTKVTWTQEIECQISGSGRRGQ